MRQNRIEKKNKNKIPDEIKKSFENEQHVHPQKQGRVQKGQGTKPTRAVFRFQLPLCLLHINLLSLRLLRFTRVICLIFIIRPHILRNLPEFLRP